MKGGKREMKKQNNNILVLVVVVLVVAVIASAISAGITANTIKVRNTAGLTKEVYTKAEIDNMFASIKTQEIKVNTLNLAKGKISVTAPEASIFIKSTVPGYGGHLFLENDDTRINFNAFNHGFYMYDDSSSLPSNIDNNILTVDAWSIRIASLARDMNEEPNGLPKAGEPVFVCADNSGYLYRSTTPCR